MTTTEKPPVSPYLTVAEIAAYSRRHADTVRLALRKKLLPGHQAGASCCWTVHRDDVDAWVRAGCPTKARKVRAA